VSGSSTAHPPTYDVVVPTIGRRSLHTLIEALDAMTGPPPQRVVIVDDRTSPASPLELPPMTSIEPVVVAGRSIGPAAARNDGWRRCTSPWIVFFDDDVVPGTDWRRELSVDVAAVGPRTAAVTASITVPLPSGRRPTDAERGVAGLETAWCITADLAVRRDAIVASVASTSGSGARTARTPISPCGSSTVAGRSPTEPAELDIRPVWGRGPPACAPSAGTPTTH
jgi:hypothetical protein